MTQHKPVETSSAIILSTSHTADPAFTDIDPLVGLDYVEPESLYLLSWVNHRGWIGIYQYFRK